MITEATKFADFTTTMLRDESPELRVMAEKVWIAREQMIERIVKAVRPHHHYADDDGINDVLTIEFESVDGHTLTALGNALGLTDSTESDRNRQPQRFGK